MISPGLVSITFRQLSPREIVDLVCQAGLDCIEWGGDIHVPHGDRARAAEVRSLTTERGFRVAAYGSYYRAGASEEEGLSFGSVLESAVALGAPTIRVWAGKQGSADADAAYRRKVADDLRRIAELAASTNITISLEFHNGTLSDTAYETEALWNAVGHSNLRTYWQPRTGYPIETGLAELALLAPRLSHIHAFHWPQAGERAHLSAGAEAWKCYFAAIRSIPGDRDAMLEFVVDNAPEAFLRDAETLKELLKIS